ncbi:MAG: beta-ketoacyl-[acyl-carrier-protein] synthase family protein [Puniceicoccales bacterium]|jgi:3-oxoacyl-[acyl-carrier-protein] synthase II|nr:beta-ketoacyl-[acyl-carrier-protein] synthase family protein [Puniceicoccales bacterium]
MHVDDERIVITGVGLTAPNGNSLEEFRQNLLAGKANIELLDIRYIGMVPAGVCDFEATRYQAKKDIRNGTRAGSIGVYCANEAILDSRVDFSAIDRSRIGVYVGITEHGNVETENEIYNLSRFGYDVRYWGHYHNPRTIANSPAGEITINLGITGPHYTIGAACAAGNAGLIQAFQMLRLGEVDMAIAGGVSESIRSFGIFAGFKSQGALGYNKDPNLVSRPFDRGRNGIVVSEGGCLYVVERLKNALARSAKIYAEIVGYGINSDATDAVKPNSTRQAECIRLALKRADLRPMDVHIVSSHATSTSQGDVSECVALREVFAGSGGTYFNNTKSFIGHAMGAAGALELAGNLPSLEDGYVHATINVDDLDPDCQIDNLVCNKAIKLNSPEIILNNSFGMMGVNSVVVVKKFSD